MSERSERLRGLEEAIRQIAPFLPRMNETERPCKDCGVDTWMKPQARYCEECGEARRAEANRQQQRDRRRRATVQRQMAAGHAVPVGNLFMQRRPVRCQHCGEEFMPKRTTARYCSTRCRVAAHRAAR